MSVASKEKLIKKLSNKNYRDAYVEESVKTSMPFQIKALREQRDWSQAILGKQTSMKQNAISRIESAEYGALGINTLLRLASAFDCALLVKFVPFSRLLSEFEDVSSKALEVSAFGEDSFENKTKQYDSSPSVFENTNQIFTATPSEHLDSTYALFENSLPIVTVSNSSNSLVH
jgi:transcriptional regulator with XRE-family HTH domain